MALHGADPALMYALGGLARGAATRGGYVSALPLIAIGGDWSGSTDARRVLVASLAIHDLLNETPNTCTFTVQGVRPTEGSEIVIASGSTASGRRLFGGAIIRVTEVIALQNPTNPKNILYQCEGIDYTWGLNARLVSARYRSASATAIGLDLLARFAPAGYTSAITAGLPDVDEITFTNTPFMECLTQLASRIGGYAKCDYFRRLWLWITLDDAMVPPPRALTPDHPSLESVSYARDLSPVVTRALVEGGGVNALEQCDPGETRIPVEDSAWYDAAGGHLVSGPQRLTYTGVVVSGGGAMASAVGGATGNTAPPSAATIGSSPGAGLPVGAYKYAYTWTTVQGESLPSPVAVWNAGSSGGPAAAPAAAAVSGTGLGLGTYKYGFTFTTATGETVPSPLAVVATGQTTTPDPSNGPTVTPAPGPGLGIGLYWYGVTFTTASGETLPGPTTSATTSTDAFPPPTYNLQLTLAAGSGLDAGTYYYAVTFVTASGETTARTSSPSITISASQAATTGQVSLTGIQPGPAGTIARKIYRRNYYAGGGDRLLTTFNNNTTTTYVDAAKDAAIAANPNPPATNTAGAPRQQVTVTGIPIGPAGTTGRKVYRSRVGGGALGSLTSIPNNTATALASPDTTPDASLGAPPPTSNTTTVNALRVALSAILAGPSGTTGRKIYRTAVNGGALKLLTTLANNSTTTYADATPDASLGAAPPVAGTAVLSQAALSAISVGPVGTNTRKIYRTSVNAPILKLVTTIANNTATTLAPDSLPDASLGAAAPTSDTSGLVSGGAGQVNAGSSTIPVASPDPFAPEGWALVGGQLLRYHGISGTAITGIPTTGIGSLGVSIPYNSPIKVVSQLTGIPASGAGAIVETILPGDPVNLLVIHDDREAQAILAALLGGTADGVVEYYDQDRRISGVEADARASAWLELRSRVLETIRYRVRDPRSLSGATVVVDLPPLGVAGSFQLQDVTIGGWLGVPSIQPTYDVVASSRRFTFEDLVRRLRPSSGSS